MNETNLKPAMEVKSNGHDVDEQNKLEAEKLRAQVAEQEANAKAHFAHVIEFCRDTAKSVELEPSQQGPAFECLLRHVLENERINYNTQQQQALLAQSQAGQRELTQMQIDAQANRPRIVTAMPKIPTKN